VITRSVVLFDFGPFETAGCPVMEVDFFENSIVTSGGQIINWLWDMGDSSYSFSSNPTHFYEDEGTYQVSLQVITADDCIYSDTLAYSIIVYPQPIANFYYSPGEVNIIHPEVEFANTSVGAQDVEWDFGDFDYSNDWNPIHLYSDTGLYQVTQIVYNEFGCSDTMTLPLYVHDNFVVFMPNTFTPDGNDLNEVFSVNGYGFDSFELLIFNRWGELIRTITEFDDYWDGTYKGQPCQDGVYTWKLKAMDFEEIPHEVVGHVNLLR